jgi:hypothetical protein
VGSAATKSAAPATKAAKTSGAKAGAKSKAQPAKATAAITEDVAPTAAAKKTPTAKSPVVETAAGDTKSTKTPAAKADIESVAASGEKSATSAVRSFLRTVVGGAVGAAGVLGAIPSVKDIIKDLQEENYDSAIDKAEMLGASLGLSFVAEAAPPLLALNVGMTYWGPEHEQIQAVSFEEGEAMEELAKNVPVLGKSKTYRRLMGAAAAAYTSVNESTLRTVEHNVSTIREGAEILGGLAQEAGEAIRSAFEYMHENEGVWDVVIDPNIIAEDVWDVVTAPVGDFEEVRRQLEDRARKRM